MALTFGDVTTGEVSVVGVSSTTDDGVAVESLPAGSPMFPGSGMVPLEVTTTRDDDGEWRTTAKAMLAERSITTAAAAASFARLRVVKASPERSVDVGPRVTHRTIRSRLSPWRAR